MTQAPIKLPPTASLIDDWAEAGTPGALARGIAPAAMHAACFLCWKALDAGVLTVEQVLGDRGIIHEMTHAASLDATRDSDFLRGLANRVREVEAAMSASQ